MALVSVIDPPLYADPVPLPAIAPFVPSKQYALPAQMLPASNVDEPPVTGRISTCRYIVPPLTDDEVSAEKYAGVLEATLGGTVSAIRSVKAELRDCLRFPGSAGVGEFTVNACVLEV